MQFHLSAQDRARHETPLTPKSSLEIEITQSSASGLPNSGGSFELELYRRNAVSSEWELVGTATVGIGSRVRNVFDSLEPGAEYTVGIFYKPHGDSIDSELSVDGNIIAH